MRSFGLVPTPELEVLQEPELKKLMRHVKLAGLHDAEKSKRALGVGSTLLQFLVMQQELNEPLNLNGDLLADILDDRVVPCPSNGDRALEAMFASVNGGPLSAASADCMLKFKSEHSIWDEDFRPPTFCRDEPSRSAPTALIQIAVKQKSDKEIKGKPPMKRVEDDHLPFPVPPVLSVLSTLPFLSHPTSTSPPCPPCTPVPPCVDTAAIALVPSPHARLAPHPHCSPCAATPILSHLHLHMLRTLVTAEHCGVGKVWCTGNRVPPLRLHWYGTICPTRTDRCADTLLLPRGMPTTHATWVPHLAVHPLLLPCTLSPNVPSLYAHTPPCPHLYLLPVYSSSLCVPMPNPHTAPPRTCLCTGTPVQPRVHTTGTPPSCVLLCPFCPPPAVQASAHLPARGHTHPALHSPAAEPLSCTHTCTSPSCTPRVGTYRLPCCLAPDDLLSPNSVGAHFPSLLQGGVWEREWAAYLQLLRMSQCTPEIARVLVWMHGQGWRHWGQHWGDEYLKLVEWLGEFPGTLSD
ncbi:hypothetical protein B0H14DRAFT_3483910 [Mycena olivaceomarginata]|nr:hypothetical protein B0H14DRAFT_3483910 [Mycena olivaceomarginata]